MKIFKLKYLTLAIVLTALGSCSSADVEEQTDKSSIKDNQYVELFKSYNNFKLDGKSITDLKAVIELLSNPIQVTNYIPEEKEINFYTSDEEYRKVYPKNLEHDEMDEKKPSSASRYSPDLGQFGADNSGVVGLGDILDQQHYRDFSKYAFIVIFTNAISHSSGATWFYRLNDDSDMTNSAEILSIYKNSTTSTINAVGNSWYISNIFGEINDGSKGAIIKNDSAYNKKLSFYEYTNYGGRVVNIYLNQNSYTTLSSGIFSNLGNTGSPNSYKSVNL